MGHVTFGSYICSKQLTFSDKFNHGSLSFIKICAWGGNLSGSSKVFEEMYHHDLTDQGLAQFDKDWKKLNS